MSISAIIVDPEDDFERSFMLPVATESFFQKYWLPAVEELKLEWAELFQDGTDVRREDIPAILDEVTRLKEWARSKMDGDDREHMLRRLELLEEELPKAYRRDDAVVYIG